MRGLIVLTLLSQIAFSKGLNYYFKLLEQNNLELKNQKAYIKISQNQTDLSQKWENPVLGVGVNDILISKKFFNRDIEAMQTQYITLSQKIPTNNKIQIKYKIAKLQEKIYLQIYKDRVLRYKALLAKKLFTYQILQKKLQVINGFLNNFHAIKKTTTALTKTTANSSKSINIDMYLVNLKLKKELLKQKIKTTKYEIEKILYRDFSKISLSTKFKKVGKTNIYNLPLIKAYRYKIAQFDTKVALSRAKKLPDLKVTAGYNNRIGRDDYFSLNLSMPLPVRGREDAEIKISTIKLQQVKNEYKSYLKSFQKESQIHKKILQSSQANYYTIQKELRSLQEQSKEIKKATIFTQNGSLLEYLTTLNTEYKIKLQALDEKQNYFDAYAKLLYYRGR